MFKIFLFVVLFNFHEIFCLKSRLSFRERVGNYYNLTQNCDRYEVSGSGYKDFIEINHIVGAQPSGYIIRFSFNVLGEKDANIILSESENPDFKRDYIYEFGIGASENTRTVIRKKVNKISLINDKTKDILSNDVALNAVIEISDTGEINLYLENELRTFVLHTKDLEPILVKYISFGSSSDSPVEFYYNCRTVNAPLKSFELIELTKKCKLTETLDKDYTIEEFQSVTEVDGTIKFPLFVRGEKNIYILLSSSISFEGRNKQYYEIAIAENDRLTFRKGEGGQVLSTVINKQLLIKSELYALFIEISTNGGLIKVFGKQLFSDQFKLLISAVDSNPVPVKFISFGSSKNTKAIFYYECPYSVSDADLVLSNYKLPLPKSIIQKTMYNEQEFLEKCNRYERSLHEYNQFIGIAQHSKPNGFYLAVSIYIRSEGDANILLSATNMPNFNTDEVYEIVIGGWSNTHSAIRIKKGSSELATFREDNLLSKNKLLKFWIEVTIGGEVRVLLEENNKLRPLVQAFHTNPVMVQYIAFSSYGNSKSEFFVNCPGDKCRLHDAIGPGFNQLYPIKNLTNAEPNGFLLSMPVYLKGDHDAEILLSSSKNVNDTIGNAYEIVIGGAKNTQTTVRKTSSKQPIAMVREPNLLSREKLLGALIEISIGGEIKISIQQNKTQRILLVAYDPNPIPIKYFSFATKRHSKVEFFYDCLL